MINLKSNRIVAISSGGGHLSELMKAIPSRVLEKTIFLTFKNGHTVKSLSDKKHFFVLDPHTNLLKYLYNFLQSFLLYLYLRPKIVISTGAGIAIPFMLIAFIFKSKLIYIETGARVNTASKTGKFLYKFSDLFIIQNENQKSVFPNSKTGSL